MSLLKNFFVIFFLLFSLNLNAAEPFSFVAISDTHSVGVFDYSSIIDNNPEYYTNFMVGTKLPQRINVIDQIVGSLMDAGFRLIPGEFSQIDIDNLIGAPANLKYRMAAIDLNKNLYLGNLDTADNFLCDRIINESVNYVATKNGKTWLLSTENVHGGYKIYTDDVSIPAASNEIDNIKIDAKSCAPVWRDNWKFLKTNEATIQFEAKALHDVIVMLSPDKYGITDFPAYTFVISGWADQNGQGTKTVLRTVNGNIGGVELGQSNYFIKTQDANKFLPYWIKITELIDGSKKISLGQSYEVGNNVILSYVDSDSSLHGLAYVNYFGISSWDVQVEYKNIKISTTENLPTRFAKPVWNDDWIINTTGKTVINFRAKASHDVFLLLSPNKSQEDDFAAYTFIIRGWNGTRTVLKDRNYYGTEFIAKESSTGDPNVLGDLNEAEFKEFCLTVDKVDENKIRLELKQGNNIIISYDDLDPILHGLSDIKYFGISSWDVPITFDDIQISDSFKIDPLSAVAYWNSQELPEINKGLIKFKAKASRDVFLLLSPEKITQDNIAAYTFIIKGWNGTRTVLKDQTLYGNELVAKESVTGDPNILGDLSETEFKEFWVKIDKTVDGQTVLQLGQDDNIIINYTDPDPASKGLNNIKYVGVSNWNIPTEYRDIKVTSCSSVAPLSCAPTWNDAWHFTKPDQATIKFKAKALHDVIVMLSPDKSSLADFPAYTFVISGWAEQTGIGTRTILRTVNGNNGGFELGQITYFIDAQDGNKFLPYWITINKIDGGKTVIKLGQSETVNKNVILSCIDPNPAANNLTNISYFGLSSWNVPVEYKEISIEKAPENTKENLEQAGFRQVQGALTQIALGSAPEIWGVNIENRVFRWSGSEWFQPKPDAILRQLTIGQYGCIWASGSDNSIWQLERSTNNWYRVDGLAKKVVLDNYNMAWVIGQDNCLYRATNNTSCHPNWKKVSNANLTDIAVKDSTDIYALNNEKVNNGYRFYVNNKDLSNNVKAVIIPGDFTTGGDANSVNRFINDWEQPLNQALKYTDGKLYVGPGNHDNDSVVWYRYTDAFNYLSDKYGDWFYSFDIEGVHFCCVGGYPSNWGIRLPSFPFVAGLYWLNGDLAQIDASAPVVIFFHYPVVGDYSDWWSKSEKDGFYNIIKNYNVKLIITGHTHASYASIWRDRFPVANVSGTSCLACKYNPATQDFNKTFIDIYNGPVSWDAMYQSLPELNPA